MTTVTTEAELRAALWLGGHILIDVAGSLPITGAEVLKLSARGTTLQGLGKATTSLDIKSDNPNSVSVWVAAQNVTIRDLTINSGFKNAHCIYSDCYNNPSYLTIDNVCIRDANDGVKYVGLLAYPSNTNFTFRNSDITNFKQKGMFLDTDLLNPVIEGFYLRGFGDRESNTGIWIGQGILGGRICNGKIENCGYNGLEVFYAHCYPTKSALSRDNPHGPGIMISGIEIDGCTNIACSLAGCKRSVISNLHIRNAGSGIEYVDEITSQDGKTLWSDYNAYGVTVANIKGVGVTIHRMKRGRFSNHIATDCGNFGVQIYDGAESIVFADSSLSRCGDRMLFCNGAPNTVVTGNEFLKVAGDPASFGFYAFGGQHIFQNNILRGGLKSGVAQATVQTAPGVPAVVSGETFSDYHNYRFT
jgi:hypothetical protein